jgi:flagellar biosynthesis chaperone FliJ
LSRASFVVIKGTVRTFRFALQPALDAAIGRERDAAVANGRAKAASEVAMRALAMLERRAAQARHVRSSLPECVAADWYLERLRNIRLRSERDAAVAGENAVRAREGFERARRASRALAILSERRRSEHLARAALLEDGELDESNARARDARRSRLGEVYDDRDDGDPRDEAPPACRGKDRS